MPEKCTEPCTELQRMEQQVEELQAQNSSSHREVFRRLNELEKSNAVQEAQYKTILAKLDTLTQKVEALEAKPGKRWEGLVEKAIGAIALAVIAFLLGRVGL